MTLLGLATGVAEQQVDLPFPPFVFALIAAGIFVALAFVVWSFRDVANRHSHKTTGRPGSGSEDH